MHSLGSEWTHSVHEWSLNGLLLSLCFFVIIWNPRWPPPQVIVLTQDHMGKYRNIFFSEAITLIASRLKISLSVQQYQRLWRACVVHLVIKRTNWSYMYLKTMSCSGSHLGIPRNNLFLKNYWAEWTHSVHECSLNGLLLSLCFLWH
jgi:hypothetical protein